MYLLVHTRRHTAGPTGEAKRALAQALGDAERSAAKLDPLLGTASPSQPAVVVGAAPFSVKVCSVGPMWGSVGCGGTVGENQNK